MPEWSLASLVGWDSDEVFGYNTQKLVWIRDRHIGYIYYSIVGSVLLWILGYQILWSNKHFLQKDVDGLARMWYSHPTVGNCDPALPSCKSDFQSLKELPYCDAYEGGQENPQRAHCSFENKITAIPSGVTDNRLFIPTAVEVVTERQACHPGPSNGYTCINEYEALQGSDCLGAGGYMCKTRGNKSNQFYYIADVRNFKIRFTSSYERDHVRGTSLMHRAHVGLCSSQMRSERRVRTWAERSGLAMKSWCGQGDVKLEMLPCAPGVECGKLRSMGPGNQSTISDWLSLGGGGLSGQQAGNRSDGLFNHSEEAARTNRSGEPHWAPATVKANEAKPLPPAAQRATATAGHGAISRVAAQQVGAAAARGGGSSRVAAPQVTIAGGRAAAAELPAEAVPRSIAEEGGQPQQGRALIQRSHTKRLEPRSSTVTEHGEEPTLPPSSPLPKKARHRHHGGEHSAPNESLLPPPIPREFLVFSDSWGDVFSIGRLLELAGVDLDNDYNMDGWTTRQAGTALEVRAVYNNLYPFWSSFGYKPVMYHYEVRELMLPYFSQFKLAEVQPDDYPLTRRYEMQYGVMISFKVGGDFGFFNVLYCFVMLATAFASIAAASTITDLIVLYLHPRRDNFFHLKYQVSADFKDMWKCSTCGFMNELDHVTCRGVPRWMGPSETPECGAERPLVAAGMHRARAKSRVSRMQKRELRRGKNRPRADERPRRSESPPPFSAPSSVEEEAPSSAEEEEERAGESQEEEEPAGEEANAAAPAELPDGIGRSRLALPLQPRTSMFPSPEASPRLLSPTSACLAKADSPRKKLVSDSGFAVTFMESDPEEEAQQPKAQDGGPAGQAAEASSLPEERSSAPAS